MGYFILMAQIAGIIIACIVVLCILLYYAHKFVCVFTKLKLYGYYTNGVYVWQLIQYDSIQATLYDTKTDRMIVMGRNEFIRDFKFLMCDTAQIEVVEGQNENK